MGADGGSIPDRRDLVKTKGKQEKTDKELERERFSLCALSKKQLAKPVVLDPLGKLYNKDAILEYLLDKSTYGDGDEICKYVKGVKDLLTLNAMPNPTPSTEGSWHAPFVCWLSLKEMTGAIPFIALRTCGCVFSERALRAVVPNLTRGVNLSDADKDKPTEEASPGPAETVACPNCGKEFDPTSIKSVMPIYPNAEIQTLLLEMLLAERAAAKANKKRKSDKGDESNGEKKKKKADKLAAAAAAESKTRDSSSPAPRPAPSIKMSTVGSSVQAMLAEEERKRLVAREGMSDAVKSMFRAKTDDKKGDAADFFGRTFNRYAA